MKVLFRQHQSLQYRSWFERPALSLSKGSPGTGFFRLDHSRLRAEGANAHFGNRDRREPARLSFMPATEQSPDSVHTIDTSSEP